MRSSESSSLQEQSTAASSPWRQHANALENEGRFRDAIDFLQPIALKNEDAEAGRRLIQLRFKAALAERKNHAPAPEFAPACVSEPFEPITKSELTPERMREGFARHNCLWVKGFFDPSTVERLKTIIDKALSAKVSDFDGKAPWFDLQTPAPFIPKAETNINVKRMRESDEGMMLYSSPMAFAAWVDIIQTTGLYAFIKKALDGTAYITSSKTMLRRILPGKDNELGWHQDGAFMGRNINTINVWAALTECGEKAPGLALLPKRTDIFPTGTDGAAFHWSVSHQLIEEAHGDDIVTPIFEAGDLLLFDGFLLHRTLMGPHMSEPRYAVESWFFTPDGYPENYTLMAI